MGQKYKYGRDSDVLKSACTLHPVCVEKYQLDVSGSES